MGPKTYLKTIGYIFTAPSMGFRWRGGRVCAATGVRTYTPHGIAWITGTVDSGLDRMREQ
jgi:hypothetical protein